MKVAAECIPCYLNQILNAMEKGRFPSEKRAEVLIELLADVAALDREKTPAENSSVILHRLVQKMGGIDPFKNAKKESNEIALEYYPKLRKDVLESADPLKQAISFAVAGNVVDLGIFADYDLGAAISEVMAIGFKIDDYDCFSKIVARAEKILIIGDNSGEIVFDMLLAEILVQRKLDVYYGVKDSFVLNDATHEDARQVGMDRICQVITNGNNFLGTIPEKCCRNFIELMTKCDLIISKGQANFESLEGTQLAGDKTFFLLKAKCKVVAEKLSVNYGELVFARNKVREDSVT
ncbi:damage-control phosphatase ARMT1 family protein [Phosphitispora sp. TUW77]|uniref:damage-control phosphatase ARMT1 family protein n=1 Tax=Phosphitispora sp. TUW77 TaxID=3152361 RepID=UPI003AB4F1FC